MGVSVQDEGEVDLSVDVDSFVNEHCVDFEAVSGGLVGLQVVADHLCGLLCNFGGGLEDLDSSLHTTAESTLASSSGVDLGLEDQDAFLDVEVLGDLFGLLRGGGNVASLDENSEFAHEVLALILVEVEESSDGSGEGFRQQ